MFRGDAGQFSIMAASESLPAAVWSKHIRKWGCRPGPLDDSDVTHGYRRLLFSGAICACAATEWLAILRARKRWRPASAVFARKRRNNLPNPTVFF